RGLPARPETTRQATSPLPIKPLNFTLAGATDTQVSLTWDTDGSATSYTLTRAEEGSTVLTTISGLPSDHHTDEGLEPDTSYNYSLVGVDSTGAHGPVATLTATTESS